MIPSEISWMPPRKSTLTSVVAWPGVAHVTEREFGPVIAAALAAEGFKEDGPDKKILVGFGHAAVMNAAEHVIKECHKAGVSVTAISGTNLCLTCHETASTFTDNSPAPAPGCRPAPCG